jgi:hypothetical protein
MVIGSATADGGGAKARSFEEYQAMLDRETTEREAWGKRP